MAMGLAPFDPPEPQSPGTGSSLVFFPHESWVVYAHPGRLQGEESGPHPTSATAGSCLSGLGMWSRSQLLRARSRMRPSQGSHPNLGRLPLLHPVPTSPHCP